MNRPPPVIPPAAPAMLGAFITTGALLSVELAAGASSEGATRLLEGFGFSAGFYFVILSGAVLFTEANWLVGMAAFFATIGRTIVGKYVPVLLAVTAFVAAGFQHSPANMGFFSLYSAFVGGLDWGSVLAWNLAPAGLGNIVGGGIAVAVLLSWTYARFEPARVPAGLDEDGESA